ncbi:MAG TPA: AmmeMemoRadiSam system radical SAM enzyme, partial [Armatimonadetes bacterium]|nr:AmmeMemoRadiSam system radical SAM enzyme [Armatimonadota bacterium]
MLMLKGRNEVLAEMPEPEREKLTRRQFLQSALMHVAGVGIACIGVDCAIAGAFAPFHRRLRKGLIKTREAMHYQRLTGRRVQCRLCPRQCIVSEGERGYCGVRENRAGTYYSLVYGNPCVIRTDPIEKKPILHVSPGSKVFTVATAGCNLNCKYCQNWQISQARPEDTSNYNLPPDELVAVAQRAKFKFIAFDYTEPVVFYEYVLDTAKLARKAGLRVIVASACFIQPKAMQLLCQHIDVLKVDLKGFSEKFYRDVCSGKLHPVLQSAKLAKRTGVWVELVNLIVPSLNDDLTEIKQMCEWIRTELGDDVPITFSRFYPAYRLRNLPPTPVSTVMTAKRIAERMGLRFVYVGNVPAS